MNSTSIIIGVGFIFLFVLPLLYISTAGSRRKKKLIAKLSSFASEKSCKISELDQWKKSCIGIDNENKKFFYLFNNECFEFDLRNISKCMVNRASNSNNGSKKQGNTKIELQFTLKNPLDKVAKIEFFDTSIDTYIVDEDLQLPDKWSNIINSAMNSNTKAVEIN